MIVLTFLRSFISLQIPMCLYLSLRLSLAPAHAAAKPSAYPQVHASPEACTRLLSVWLMLTVCIPFQFDLHYVRLWRLSANSQQLYFYAFMLFGLSVHLSVHPSIIFVSVILQLIVGFISF